MTCIWYVVFPAGHLDAFSHNNQPLCWFFPIHWLKLTSVSVADKYNCSGSILPSKNSFVLRRFLDPWWYFRCAQVTSYLSQRVAPNSYHTFYATEPLVACVICSLSLSGSQALQIHRDKWNHLHLSADCLRLFWIEMMFLLKHMCPSELWRMFKLYRKRFCSLNSCLAVLLSLYFGKHIPIVCIYNLKTIFYSVL